MARTINQYSRKLRKTIGPAYAHCAVLVAILASALLASPFYAAASSSPSQSATLDGETDAPTANSLSFRQAVELALQNSGTAAIANLNRWRSFKVYQETKSNYIPQLTAGSGLGYSYGFPLTLEGSAPSVANFNAQGALFNISLRDFLKAARIDWKASSFDVQDKRNAVILDTALCYAQLEQLAGKIKTLTDAQAAAQKAQFVTEQRLEQGVDSKLEFTRAQLVAARMRLRIADAEAQADVLREHLSKLTGVPAGQLAIQPQTMPALPAISQDDDVSSHAVETSPAVRLADQKAAAADMKAKGEHHALLPTADLAAQYARLATYNNYDVYFKRYTPNNLAAGVNIRFPFFNLVQKRKAEEADADAMMAHKQADMTRNDVRENVLKLQRSLRQLTAARDVAKLDWQVAQGELEASRTRVDSGNATTRDLQNAQLQVDDKYATYLDTEFELRRATLQLLRITGELENWAVPPQ